MMDTQGLHVCMLRDGVDARRAVDPRASQPLIGVLVQHSTGSPMGWGRRKLTINALQISPLQIVCVSQPSDHTGALCSKSLFP